MLEIVKICKKHGELTISNVYEESMNKGLTFRLRCKQCRSDYEKNSEKRKAYSKEYERTKRKRPEGYNEWHKERYRVSARESRRKNADKINEKIRNERKENPEKYREYDRKWRAENLMKARELDVIQKHNISYDEYKWMCDKQRGRCAICKKEETRKSRTSGQICRLTIDHNHETGIIRELLCHNCNQVIGHCKESIKTLKKAILYLKKHANAE